jgi:surface protein
MATISAEAKLYNSFRLINVDKSARAQLYSQLVIGADVEKIVSYVADIESASSVSLTNNRYLTYGGRSVMQSTLSLRCIFPMFLRFDLEALGMPQGTDIILQLEEGFLIEGDYPGSGNKALPANLNLMAFRTPKKFASYPNISASLANLILRIKPLASDVFTLFSPSFTVVANRVGFIESDIVSSLQAGLTYSNALFVSNMSVTSSLPGDFNYRLKYFDSTFDTVTSTMPDVPGRRLRLLDDDFSMTTALSADVVRNIGPITADIISESTVLCNAVKTAEIIETEDIISSLSLQITKTTRFVNQNLAATSSLSVESTVPMILTTTTTTTNKTRVLNIWFGTINAIIDWGDGTVETVTATPGFTPGASFNNLSTGVTPSIRHTYATAGNYTITIGGSVQHWGFVDKSNLDSQGDSSVYRTLMYEYNIQSFGYIGITTLVGAFWDSMLYDYTAVPARIPDTVTDISWIFYHTSSDSVSWVYDNVASWDTSNVTKMHGSFYRARGGFNTNLSNWDTENVTNMAEMFRLSDHTGLGLSNWDTGSATNVGYMFYQAKRFNANINEWDVSNVTYFAGMLGFTNTADGATGYQQPLWKWDTGSATDMTEMLFTGYDYDQDLTYWCVTNITTRPTNFSANNISERINEPAWGSCPGPRPVVSSISLSSNPISESNVLTVTVNFSNVTTGTVYFIVNQDYPNWILTNNGDTQPGTTGRISYGSSASDVTNLEANQTLTIASGQAQFQLNINADTQTENNEFFRIEIVSKQAGDYRNFLLASSSVITIPGNST